MSFYGEGQRVRFERTPPPPEVASDNDASDYEGELPIQNIALRPAHLHLQ